MGKDLRAETYWIGVNNQTGEYYNFGRGIMPINNDCGSRIPKGMLSLSFDQLLLLAVF